jgi:hypothetical protein
LVLAATILLVLVSVSVPVLKSIYFLQANIDVSAVRVNAQASGSITLGVWGYCVSGIGSGQTCSNVSLGYELSELVTKTVSCFRPVLAICWWLVLTEKKFFPKFAIVCIYYLDRCR